MKQFSIKGLERLLEEDKVYSSIEKENNRLLFIDKCNWLLSKIMRTQLQNEKGLNELVNIHTDSLKKFLGDRYYKTIISSLESVKVVYVNRTYSSGRFSYSYSINHISDKDNIELVPVNTKRFEKKLIIQSAKDLEETSRNPLLNKIIKNTSKLYLTNNRKNYLYDFVGDLKYDKNQPEDEYIIVWYEDNVQLRLNKYDAYFVAFRELNKSDKPIDVYKLPVFFSPTINSLGRVYHLAASVPRLIRRCFITKDMEAIWEVDMASAQPSILMLEWIKAKRKNTSLSESERTEINLCLELISNGKIYKHIVENSKQLKEMEYAKMKKSILTTLNSKIIETQLYKELQNIFPSFMAWIDDLKRRKDYRAVSHLGMSTEAKIFISVYKDLPEEMFAIPIHDCILLKEADTIEVQALLINRVKHLYQDILKDNYALAGLFKVSQVTS
jgi:hypothetical protein